MIKYLDLKATIALGLAFIFLVSSIGPIPAFAQANECFYLPAPGQMVALTPAFSPAVLKGIKLDPQNPFRFHFYVDQGDSFPKQEQLKAESAKLIKYFLASLTIPETDLWVNLSPYEKDRIIPSSFGQTEMGRDLLAEDYILKQITASLIYPESRLGKEFWAKVYAQAQAKYGTTNIPINTFNKVWIVPDKAVVYENAGTAFVLENHLKVMLEQDYLSLQKHSPSLVKEGVRGSSENINTIGSQIIREIVIPELTTEVNQGKNFAPLRQVFYSLILATWYKKKIKDSILNKIYTDKDKIQGVGYNTSIINRRQPGDMTSVVSPSTLPSELGLKARAPQGTNQPPNNDVEFIYQQYLQAFKKGVYNYIKEEPLFPPPGGEGQGGGRMPRKYFSGGWEAQQLDQLIQYKTPGHADLALLTNSNNKLMDIRADFSFKFKDQAMKSRKPSNQEKFTDEELGWMSKERLDECRSFLDEWSYERATHFLIHRPLVALNFYLQSEQKRRVLKIESANQGVHAFYLFLQRHNKNLAFEFYRKATDLLFEAAIKTSEIDPKILELVRQDPVKLNDRITTWYNYRTLFKKPFPDIEENVAWDDQLPVIGWQLFKLQREWIGPIQNEIEKKKDAHFVIFTEADIIDQMTGDDVYLRSGFVVKNGELRFEIFKNPLKLDVTNNADFFPSIDSTNIIKEPLQQGRLLSQKTFDLISDKYLQSIFFEKYGINAPQTVRLDSQMSLQAIFRSIGDAFIPQRLLKIFVKPNRSRQGKGNHEFLLLKLENLATAAHYANDLMHSGDIRMQKVIVQKSIDRDWFFRSFSYRDSNNKLRVCIFVYSKGLWRALDDPIVKDNIGEDMVLRIREQTLPFMKKMFADIKTETGQDPVFLTPDLTIDEKNLVSIFELNWGFGSFPAVYHFKEISEEVMPQIFSTLINRAKEAKAADTDQAMMGAEQSFDQKSISLISLTVAAIIVGYWKLFDTLKQNSEKLKNERFVYFIHKAKEGFYGFKEVRPDKREIKKYDIKDYKYITGLGPIEETLSGDADLENYLQESVMVDSLGDIIPFDELEANNINAIHIIRFKDNHSIWVIIPKRWGTFKESSPSGGSERPSLTIDRAMNSEAVLSLVKKALAKAMWHVSDAAKELTDTVKDPMLIRDVVIPALEKGMDDQDAINAVSAFNILKIIDPKYASVLPLDVILREAIYDNMVMATEKNIKISPHFPKGHVFIEEKHRSWARGNLGSTVMRELINNAIKYTPENGTITVTLREEGIQTIFSIQDTGIGIPVSEQDKVWGEAYRAPNASSFAPGTGLGLPMMRAVVQKNYAGQVEFKSEEGHGTIFTVRIPTDNVPVDLAMKTTVNAAPGGIDLNPAQLSMQVRKEGEDFKYDFKGTVIDTALVTGVTFTIRSMTPVTNLQQVVGLSEQPVNNS